LKNKNNITLIILFVGVLMGALDIAIIGPALPAIETGLGMPARAGSWVFTIFVLFNLLGIPLMSKLSDRFGRRSIYVADLLLFGMGSLLVALSRYIVIPGVTLGGLDSRIIMLLLGRGIQGFGAGGIFPVASAVIGDVFPKEKQGGALGLIGAVFGLAFIIGPILGGVLLTVGWQWLFLINPPIVLVLILFAPRYLPGKTKKANGAFDRAGLLSLFILLGALTVGINQIDTKNFIASALSLNVWPFFIIAAAAVPLFLFFEKRASDPVINTKLYRNRRLILANILTIGAGFAESSLVFLPLLATVVFGYSESAASYTIIPMVLALAVGAPLFGRLLDKIGPRKVILTGTLLLSTGMAVTGIFLGSPAWYYIATIIIGFGLSSLLGAPLRYIVLTEAPPDFRASLQGGLSIFTGIGQLTGGAVVGTVIAGGQNMPEAFRAAYFTVAGVAVLLFILAAFLKKRK